MPPVPTTPIPCGRAWPGPPVPLKLSPPSRSSRVSRCPAPPGAGGAPARARRSRDASVSPTPPTPSPGSRRRHGRQAGCGESPLYLRAGLGAHGGIDQLAVDEPQLDAGVAPGAAERHGCGQVGVRERQGAEGDAGTGDGGLLRHGVAAPGGESRGGLACGARDRLARRTRVQEYAPQRNCRKNWRTSATSKSGSSMAAKWPPRSNSLQCTMLSDSSAKRLIGGAIS